LQSHQQVLAWASRDITVPRNINASAISVYADPLKRRSRDARPAARTRPVDETVAGVDALRGIGEPLSDRHALSPRFVERRRRAQRARRSWLNAVRATMVRNQGPKAP
jgi:hypothetical protein